MLKSGYRQKRVNPVLEKDRKWALGKEMIFAQLRHSPLYTESAESVQWVCVRVQTHTREDVRREIWYNTAKTAAERMNYNVGGRQISLVD